jgi:hypothetical protein
MRGLLRPSQDVTAASDREVREQLPTGAAEDDEDDVGRRDEGSRVKRHFLRARE